MRIMTHNLAGGARRGAGSGWAEAVAPLRADIVALQEVLDTVTGSRLDRLAETLGLHAVFAGNFPSPRGVLGNALLSETRIVEYDNVDVSWPRREPRGILRVRLETGLEVFNVHFGLRLRERCSQWSRVLEMCDHLHGPVLVCGDFNDWSGVIDRSARRAGLVNALRLETRRRTYPAILPLFALDRIYVNGLETVAAEVLRGRPWSRVSDHLPVVADLAPPTGGWHR